MNFLELIKALLNKPRLPAIGSAFGAVRVHTNPARNRQRKLVKQLGNRQCRRQFKLAYERRAMGLASHQVVS